jgi:hypothetical protein
LQHQMLAQQQERINLAQEQERRPELVRYL